MCACVSGACVCVCGGGGGRGGVCGWCLWGLVLVWGYCLK